MSRLSLDISVGDRRLDVRTILALIVTIVLWASAFTGIRVALQGYTPGELALLRFIIASLSLLIYALFTRMRLPAWRDLPFILLLGFIGIVVYQVALNFGEQTVSAGASSLLVASVPCFTALLATAFLHERLNWWGWIGIVVGFLGVALISLGGRDGLHFSPGALLILLASVAESIFFVLERPLFKKYTGFELSTYTIWAATLFMFVYAPGLFQQLPLAPLNATLAVVYLGIFPAALAYGTWSFALSRTSASTTTSFLYIVPFFSILIAWLWLGEIPTLITLLGGLIVIIGVMLVNTLGRKA